MIAANTSPSLRSRLPRQVLGGLAVAFGIATLFEGGQVLFGGSDARAAAGNVVLFVLIFNFSAAFMYVIGGLSTLLNRRWSVWVARALAVATLFVFAALGVHVLSGGAYETRTLIAMTVRSGFWGAQALLLPRVLTSQRQ